LTFYRRKVKGKIQGKGNKQLTPLSKNTRAGFKKRNGLGNENSKKKENYTDSCFEEVFPEEETDSEKNLGGSEN